MIEASGISKSYGGRPVLSGIDFAAAPGESVVIVGRNGAGKSTLLSILAGFLRPDSGKVSAAKENTAFCPQEDNLFEELSAADNLLFWARVRARAAPASAAMEDSTVTELSALFGVNEYKHKKVSQLSGGMKKCVAIICALSNNADVLILDEPFSGLDIFYKNTLLSAFGRLKSSGKCIIYTSHNIDEILGLDSKVYVLSGGKLTYIDTLDKDSGYELIRKRLLEYIES